MPQPVDSPDWQYVRLVDTISDKYQDIPASDVQTSRKLASPIDLLLADVQIAAVAFHTARAKRIAFASSVAKDALSAQHKREVASARWRVEHLTESVRSFWVEGARSVNWVPQVRNFATQEEPPPVKEDVDERSQPEHPAARSSRKRGSPAAKRRRQSVPKKDVSVSPSASSGQRGGAAMESRPISRTAMSFAFGCELSKSQQAALPEGKIPPPLQEYAQNCLIHFLSFLSSEPVGQPARPMRSLSDTCPSRLSRDYSCLNPVACLIGVSDAKTELKAADGSAKAQIKKSYQLVEVPDEQDPSGDTCVVKVEPSYGELRAISAAVVGQAGAGGELLAALRALQSLHKLYTLPLMFVDIGNDQRGIVSASPVSFQEFLALVLLKGNSAKEWIQILRNTVQLYRKVSAPKGWTAVKSEAEEPATDGAPRRQERSSTSGLTDSATGHSQGTKGGSKVARKAKKDDSNKNDDLLAMPADFLTFVYRRSIRKKKGMTAGSTLNLRDVLGARGSEEPEREDVCVSIARLLPSKWRAIYERAAAAGGGANWESIKCILLSMLSTGGSILPEPSKAKLNSKNLDIQVELSNYLNQLSSVNVPSPPPAGTPVFSPALLKRSMRQIANQEEEPSPFTHWSLPIYLASTARQRRLELHFWPVEDLYLSGIIGWCLQMWQPQLESPVYDSKAAPPFDVYRRRFSQTADLTVLSGALSFFFGPTDLARTPPIVEAKSESLIMEMTACADKFSQHDPLLEDLTPAKQTENTAPAELAASSPAAEPKREGFAPVRLPNGESLELLGPLPRRAKEDDRLGLDGAIAKARDYLKSGGFVNPLVLSHIRRKRAGHSGSQGGRTDDILGLQDPCGSAHEGDCPEESSHLTLSQRKRLETTLAELDILHRLELAKHVHLLSQMAMKAQVESLSSDLKLLKATSTERSVKAALHNNRAFVPLLNILRESSPQAVASQTPFQIVTSACDSVFYPRHPSQDNAILANRLAVQDIQACLGGSRTDTVPPSATEDSTVPAMTSALIDAFVIASKVSVGPPREIFFGDATGLRRALAVNGLPRGVIFICHALHSLKAPEEAKPAARETEGRPRHQVSSVVTNPLDPMTQAGMGALSSMASAHLGQLGPMVPMIPTPMLVSAGQMQRGQGQVMAGNGSPITVLNGLRQGGGQGQYNQARFGNHYQMYRPQQSQMDRQSQQQYQMQRARQDQMWYMPAGRPQQTAQQQKWQSFYRL